MCSKDDDMIFTHWAEGFRVNGSDGTSTNLTESDFTRLIEAGAEYWLDRDDDPEVWATAGDLDDLSDLIAGAELDETEAPRYELEIAIVGDEVIIYGMSDEPIRMPVSDLRILVEFLERSGLTGAQK